MMKNRIAIALLTAAFSAAGCATNNAMNKPFESADKPGAVVQAPPGAQFTILCQTYTGESHVATSDKVRLTLFSADTKLDKWYVVHSADKSMLYYGFYKSNNPRDPVDGAEGERAIADQNAIRALADSTGKRLFSTCVIESIDTPDPDANPAWDLTRSRGYWTLQIAAYKTGPQRKELAVAAVKEARASGVEAYYYHGPSISSVCIGSWPKESVIERMPGANDSNPDVEKVYTSGNLPLGDHIPDGTDIVQPTVEVLDPTLVEALRTYHEHSVDGYTIMKMQIDPRTGAETKMPEQPILARIPERADPRLAAMTDPALADPDHSMNVPRPGTSPGSDLNIEDPGTSKLQSRDQK
jgi:hypothetical protein